MMAARNFILVLEICLFLRVTAAPASNGNSCTDSGAWVAGGLVSCRDLTTPNSASGIYKNPRKFCDQYWENCCSTCSQLFLDTTKVAVASTPTRTPVKTDKPSGGNTCKDTNPVIAGGVVPCTDLTKPNSATSIDKIPKKFCDQHWNECCFTCSQLFPDATNGHYTVIVQSTPSPTTVNPVSPTGSSVCFDSGTSIADGIVPCSDLIEPNSATGVDKNPWNFCVQHWNECCKTCNKLFPNGTPTKQLNPSSIKQQSTTTSQSSTKIVPAISQQSTSISQEDSLKQLLKESNEMLKDVTEMLKNIFWPKTKKDSLQVSHRYALFVSNKKR